MAHRFKIDDTITRCYRRFSAEGTQLTVRLIPPPDDSEPVRHFLASVNDLFQHTLENIASSDIVKITIQNRLNQNDKAIGISFRRKDQFSGDVTLSAFEEVSQSNSRFDDLDKMVVTLHSVKMPVLFGRAMKTMGRPVSVMTQPKKSIIEVKAADNCFANTLIIAIGREDNYSSNKSYRNGWKIRPVVRNLIEMIGIDLSNGVGIPELVRLQENFRDYKILVYEDLSCDNIIFEGQVESSKRLNLF